jgi:hypothetical protein
MTETQLREVIRDTVKETLVQYGMESSDLTDVQKDLAFVRRCRTYSEQIGSKVVCVVVGLVVVGIVGGIWLAVKQHLSRL